MKIYAISDLHLSLTSDKPMNVFGDNWHNHHQRIADNWQKNITADDLILISGDVSWALKLNAALADLQWLANLPGQKIIIRGNHDYWWSSLNKITAATDDSMHFIQNNSININGVSITGTRLWDYPFISWPNPIQNSKDNQTRITKVREPVQGGQIIDNEKVCASELNRLKLGLAALDQNAKYKICLTHYPPVSRTPEVNQFTNMIKQAGVDCCVYGHLHALEHSLPTPASDCILDDVRYILASCDWLDFNPIFIAEV